MSNYNKLENNIMDTKTSIIPDNSNECMTEEFYIKLEKIEEAKRLSDEETYKKYEYLFGNMSEYDKLATFMNNDLGYVYITGNEIKEILEEEIC